MVAIVGLALDDVDYLVRNRRPERKETPFKGRGLVIFSSNMCSAPCGSRHPLLSFFDLISGFYQWHPPGNTGSHSRPCDQQGTQIHRRCCDE